MKGTLEDRTVIACLGSIGFVWAIILFIKFGLQLHAVMVPVWSDPNNVHVFLDFMKNDHESISGVFCIYDPEQKAWKIGKKGKPMIWPKDDHCLD